jgi:hypothetical protein
MDYRDETPGWSECSTSDFADYVNSQVNFCLERINPTFTDTVKKGNIYSTYEKRKRLKLEM